MSSATKEGRSQAFILRLGKSRNSTRKARRH